MKHAKHLVHWLFVCMVLIGASAWAQDSVTYVYCDPQGTPLAEADASGNITATFEYTPYGTYAPRGTSQPGPAPSGPGYTGHVNDPETKLVYMQARYYDPATGHFLSVDPMVPEEGNTFNFNRYDYANNNPVVNLDPTGRACGAVGEVGPKIQRMRDIADNCGENANSPSQSSTRSSGQGSAIQYLIGILKGTSNELCKIPIVSCDESPDAPSLTASNDKQEAGMRGGVFIVQAGEAAVTDGEFAETEVHIWTSTGSKTSVENAFLHWKKHAEEFPEYRNSLQYVQGARRFVKNPPNGTLTKMRANGDTLLYDPRTNTFAVKAANGSPRTMFRPAGGRS